MVRLHWLQYSHPINLYPPPPSCYLFIVTNSSLWDPRQGAAYSQAILCGAHPHPLSSLPGQQRGVVPLPGPWHTLLQGHDQGGSPDFPQRAGIQNCPNLPSIKRPNKSVPDNERRLLNLLSEARLFNTTLINQLFLETIRAFTYFSLCLLLSSLHCRSRPRLHQPAKTKKNPHQINTLGKTPNLLLHKPLPLLVLPQGQVQCFPTLNHKIQVGIRTSNRIKNT